MAHHDPALPIDPDLDSDLESFRGRSRRMRPDVLAAIALGGMVGATARYGLALWLPTRPGRFPWATFWTNLSGSFLLGLLLVVVIDRSPPIRRAGTVSGRSPPHGGEHRPQSAHPATGPPVSGRSLPQSDGHRPQSSLRRLVRPFATTGILGAFTTMSTFEVETALLLKDGHAPTAVLYLAASLVTGLALAYAGIRTGRRLPVAGPR
jgi:fluoride exporter